MYQSSANFNGWCKLKRESRKNFDIIVPTKSVVFLISLWAGGLQPGSSLPPECPSGPRQLPLKSFPIRHVQFSSIPNMVKFFFSPPWSIQKFGVHVIYCYMGTQKNFPGVKRPQREAHQLSYLVQSLRMSGDITSLSTHGFVSCTGTDWLTDLTYQLWNHLRKPLVTIFGVLFEISNVDGISI